MKTDRQAARALVVRFATCDDADMLAELARAVRSEPIAPTRDGGDRGDVATPLDVASTIRDELGKGSAKYLVALWTGQPVGWLKLTPRPPPRCVRVVEAVELAYVDVAPPYRGCHLEHALVQRALTHAARTGARRIWSVLAVDDTSTRELLARWNFVPLENSPENSPCGANDGVLLVRGLSAAERTPRVRPAKIASPFTSDSEIAELVARFEDGTWPYERWTHAAHLAVGLAYVRTMTFEEALARLRGYLRLYNQSQGDPTGYNETVTRLFLRRLAASNGAGGDPRPLYERVSELAGQFTVEWLYRYYSKDLIWSPAARRAWVDPDRMPLDF